eukprot:5259343-Pleurochrysis_carterae.AAC.2
MRRRSICRYYNSKRARNCECERPEIHFARERTCSSTRARARARLHDCVTSAESPSAQLGTPRTRISLYVKPISTPGAEPHSKPTRGSAHAHASASPLLNASAQASAVFCQGRLRPML